ncbi:MAG: hypothetical protein EHM55_22765 [Acidobacteria bacterium]|nr:MAG: hypothetical protein EHM55_22765 [Acidobacteriota bacterium]
MPNQMRRVTRGEVSSGSRELTLAAVAAAVVVFPARLAAGGAGGLGGAGCAAAAAGATGAAGAAGLPVLSAAAPPGAEVEAP